MLIRCILGQDDVFENKDVHVGGKKAAVCIFRRTDDRFTANIETCVYQNGAASQAVEGLKQASETRIPVLINGLNSCTEVNMRHSGNLGANHINTVAKVGILLHHSANLPGRWEPGGLHERVQPAAYRGFLGQA